MVPMERIRALWLQQRSWYKVFEKHIFYEHLKKCRRVGVFFGVKNSRR